MTCSKRLWPHVVALGAILCVLVLAFGRNSLVRDGLVSADEGAVLSQMEVRRTTGDWGMPNPLPAVDPDARWFGISGSDLDADRAYPYAKHVAYPAVAQPFFDLGGARLVVGLSAVGSLVTAALAALLARRVRRDLDVPTLWVVGIVSPIFFDSFWAIAHSMGAAFATGAVLAAVVAIERRQARWIPLAALAVAAAMVGTAAFGGLGLSLAGSLPALVNLALCNGLYVVLVMTGDIVFRAGSLPGPIETIARLGGVINGGEVHLADAQSDVDSLFP